EGGAADAGARGAEPAPSNGNLPYTGAGQGSPEAVQQAVGHYADDEEKPWYMRALDTFNANQKGTSDLIKSGQKAADDGTDSIEKMAADNGEAANKQVEGIPVLEQMVQAGSFLNKELTEVEGGVAKGALSMIGGAANMATHPLDAMASAEDMAEHVPGL